jgi:hypothetical protein
MERPLRKQHLLGLGHFGHALSGARIGATTVVKR